MQLLANEESVCFRGAKSDGSDRNVDVPVPSTRTFDDVTDVGSTYLKEFVTVEHLVAL